MNHPAAMAGITNIVKLLTCSARYAFGSSTPTAKSPIARMIRITSSVISLKSPQDLGSNAFAPYGPIAMPNAVPRTTSPKNNYRGTSLDNRVHGGLRERGLAYLLLH